MKMGIKDIKRKKQEGFTIIEVMIVLVIAAVILLMVFLAVPALQRNSRNTQRKNDVANLLAAVNEYASNNNGQMPDSLDDFKDNVQTGFYSLEDGEEEVIWGGTTTPTGEFQEVHMNNGASCNGNTPQDGTSRQFVAYYNLESSNGLDQTQCQQG